MTYIKKDNTQELNEFLEELPYKLRIELSLYIYEKRYCKIKFFKDRSASFVSWMCQLLKPQNYLDMQMMGIEGEEISEISFIINGTAQFVLPAFNNLAYIQVCTGQSYGVIDLISSCSTLDIDFYEEWYEKKLLMHRQFTIQSLGNTEILNFGI